VSGVRAEVPDSERSSQHARQRGRSLAHLFICTCTLHIKHLFIKKLRILRPTSISSLEKLM
jgi:hypothetical protein